MLLFIRPKIPEFSTRVNRTEVSRVNVLEIRVLLNPRDCSLSQKLCKLCPILGNLNRNLWSDRSFQIFQNKSYQKLMLHFIFLPEFLNLLEWFTFWKHSGIFRWKFSTICPHFETARSFSWIECKALGKICKFSLKISFTSLVLFPGFVLTIWTNGTFSENSGDFKVFSVLIPRALHFSFGLGFCSF